MLRLKSVTYTMGQVKLLSHFLGSSLLVKRGLFGGKDMEVEVRRTGLLTQLCHHSPTLAAWMVKGLDKVCTLLKQEF